MRVSRKILESRVAYLNKLLGFEDGGPMRIELDHHQPGSNKCTWKVILGYRRDMANGKWYYLESQAVGPSGRMTAQECESMLNGVIWGIEHARERGFAGYQLEPNGKPQ